MAASSVVHVLWEGPVGGIQRLVHQIARRQREQGLAVAVAFGRPVGTFVDALVASGVEVLDLGIGSGFDVRPDHVARAAAKLRRFEVIHLHAFNAPLGAAIVAARRPVVCTEHGSYYVGHRFGAVKRALQRRFLTRRRVLIAANSHYTAERLAAQYGFGRHALHVVPNGVDFGPAPDQSTRAANPHIVVGFVGRWADVKRLDRLLIGLAQARRHADVRAVLVGGGPNEADLRRLAAELGVTDVVEFLGQRLELDALLDRMDVLVQTGVESFGMSVVEGCGRGALPLVFADAGGAVEILPPDGVVVDDVDAFGRALAALPGTPALAPAARAQRAAWVRANYDIAATVAGYGRLYERALAQRG